MERTGFSLKNSNGSITKPGISMFILTRADRNLQNLYAQSAEKELPELEAAAEYSLQRRANIILYNSFADMQQTNIGLETDILNTGGTTTLVNNKMVVYFDANHANLKRQVRQGIADVITENRLIWR